MFKKSKYIALLLTSIYILFSCKSDFKNNPSTINFENTPTIIDTCSARIGLFHKEYFSNGIIKAKTKLGIYTQHTGCVNSILVSPGMYITRGAPICKLNNNKLRDNLKLKKQEYDKALIDLENILLGWNYHLSDSGKIPKQRWETACIRSGFYLRKTELEILLLQKKNLTIHAPISGVISNINIEPAQMLNPNELICNISDMSKLIIEFNMIENDFFNIRKGLNIQARPYSTNKIFEGEIIDINPQINENGLFTVHAEINNSKLELVDGMKVKIKILGKDKETLLIPKEAIIKRNKENIVFTYKQNKAVWNFVTVDDENSTVSAISEGLRPNDIVITKGNLFLNQDSPVKIAFKASKD
ncbi:MAG: efflux RND transporter periplasmic adaptor subunit [Bacteroidales bacterium]|nr:efflux RND transporter periplasmic adaptor subunit [Bacteroidales bacterium]